MPKREHQSRKKNNGKNGDGQRPGAWVGTVLCSTRSTGLRRNDLVSVFATVEANTEDQAVHLKCLFPRRPFPPY